jgi:hypothetical protein
MFTKIKEFFLGTPKTVEAVEVPYKVETPAVEAKPAPVAKAKPAPAKKAPAPKPAVAKMPRAKKTPAK